MREIKFRAWIKKEEIMTYFEDESYILNGDMSVDAFDYDKSNCKNYFEPCYKTVDVELMQYTGLKDKNGVEIYEGDILQNVYDDDVGIIEWSEEDAMFVLTIDNLETNFSNERSKHWEVIGNIYDNPELLKGE